MKFSWKWASVICVLILGIVGSVAVAAPKDGGGDGSSDERRGTALGGPRQHLADLATELGVSTAELRDALEAMRDELGPPERPRRGQRPSREELEQLCTRLTDALASELDKSGDDVRAAIKTVAKAKIEEAVDADRISRARADRILERIVSAECLPPFGPPGVFGCAGRPGSRGGERGDRGAELPAPPPGAPPPAWSPAS